MFRVLLLILLTIGLLPAQEVIFTGLPSVRIDADGKESIKVELSDQGSQKYAVRITKKGRKFYWATRGNRELIRSDAGDFVYFISPEGTGYIKIFTGGSGEPYGYMEHLTSGFKNITYWGKTTQMLPQK